jgi:hypothetical protein
MGMQNGQDSAGLFYLIFVDNTDSDIRTTMMQ